MNFMWCSALHLPNNPLSLIQLCAVVLQQVVVVCDVYV